MDKDEIEDEPFVEDPAFDALSDSDIDTLSYDDSTDSEESEISEESELSEAESEESEIDSDDDQADIEIGKKKPGEKLQYSILNELGSGDSSKYTLIEKYARRTKPIMTQYEFARLLSARSMQLQNYNFSKETSTGVKRRDIVRKFKEELDTKTSPLILYRIDQTQKLIETWHMDELDHTLKIDWDAELSI
jgi:DNA-directed RNA polymerase subunit K/omega